MADISAGSGIVRAGAEAYQGGNILDRKLYLDFMTGIVLLIVAAYVILDSLVMAGSVGGPFYTTPGMLPIVLGLALALTAVLLLKRSIREEGVKNNLDNIKTWACVMCKSKTVKEMLLGILILGVYTFLLVPAFPFWLSGLIFLVFIMGVLNATSLVRSLIISAVTVASIVVVFEVIFHVPLP